MAARTPEQAPPPSALAERFDTQAGVAPNFLNKAPELELAALPNGEPVVFGFDDETRAQREALGKLLGAPRGYEVAQLLLLPASDNMASQSGETLKGVFLVKNLATGALSFGGVEFDDIGNIVVPKDPGARGRWPIDEGQSVKIGKAGNDLLKSEAGDDGAYIMPTRVLFSEVFSGKVDDGQLTITAEKGAFKVVSHGTNPTNILVNREQQPKEELRRLTVLGPEAQGELAQSLEVPPEVGLTTPEKHPVPLDTARQEVLEALNPSEPKAVIDKTTSGANNPENDSDMAALPESAEVSERTIINLTQEEYTILDDVMKSYERANNAVMYEARTSGRLPDFSLIEGRQTYDVGQFLGNTQRSSDLRALVAIFAAGSSHNIQNMIGFKNEAERISGLSDKEKGHLSSIFEDLVRARGRNGGDLDSESRQFIMTGITSALISERASDRLKSVLSALSVGVEIGNPRGMAVSSQFLSRWVEAKK